MSQTDQLITDHIDIWTSAILAKSTSGRGSSKKYELYGITKLRELILELAVRGKLVPQDPNDEPASVLLEKIVAEKAQLVKEKKIKKPKNLSEIKDNNTLFETPLSWCWRYLQDVSSYIQRGKGPSYAEDGKVRVVSQKCIQWKGFDLTPCRYVSDESLEKYQEERYLQDNDLLWNSTGTGTVGRVNTIDSIEKNSLVADSHVTVIRPLLINSKFLRLYLSSPFIQRRIDPNSENPLVSGSTKQVELNTSTVNLLLAPVPPLQEQHRIVAKVDELMRLCDDLEQQTEASVDTHTTLVEVLLTTLTDSADANELAQNWARVSKHFDTLFTTEQSIEAFKQTALQLAVMGKLVPQDSNDEPASVLLEKIAEEKERLVKEKKIKSQKSLLPISDDKKLFELPQGWEWCQLDDLSLSSEAGWSPQCEPTQREGNNWGVLKVSAVTWGRYQPNENKALPVSLEPRPQYEVKAGDFLISRANTAELVARAVVVPLAPPEKLMMSDKIIRFSFSKEIFSEYINLANNSNHSRDYYAAVAGGTSSSMRNVSRNQVRALAVALPPHNEQHRIVAKVDELMQICDQLKAKLKQSQVTQVQLTDALVEQALA